MEDATDKSTRVRRKSGSGDGREVRLSIGSLLVKGEQFLTIDGYIAGSFDTQPDLAAVDVDHGDTDVVPDENFLPKLPTED